MRVERDLTHDCSKPCVFLMRPPRPRGSTGTGPVGGRPELPVLGLLVQCSRHWSVPPLRQRWPQNIVSAVSMERALGHGTVLSLPRPFSRSMLSPQRDSGPHGWILYRVLLCASIFKMLNSMLSE